MQKKLRLQQKGWTRENFDWSKLFEEEKIDNSGRKHEWIWIVSVIQGRKAGVVTKSCSKFVTMALITKIAKNRTQNPYFG